jgi:hypothetical protein
VDKITYVTAELWHSERGLGAADLLVLKLAEKQVSHRRFAAVRNDNVVWASTRTAND